MQLGNILHVAGRLYQRLADASCITASPGKKIFPCLELGKTRFTSLWMCVTCVHYGDRSLSASAANRSSCYRFNYESPVDECKSQHIAHFANSTRLCEKGQYLLLTLLSLMDGRTESPRGL